MERQAAFNTCLFIEFQYQNQNFSRKGDSIHLKYHIKSIISEEVKMEIHKLISIIICTLLFTVGCASIGSDAPTEDTSKFSVSDIMNDESKISKDVNLSVDASGDGNLLVSFKNEGSENIDHGYAIYLEKEIDGTWYLIPEIAAYADESSILEPYKEFTQTEKLDNWDVTKKGIFRMYKKYYSTDANRPATETEKYSISNEFELKE